MQKTMLLTQFGFYGEVSMIYRIGRECVNCGHCMRRCPQKAIHKGEDTYVIDRKLCNGCGYCVMVCPTGAPVQEEENA